MRISWSSKLPRKQETGNSNFQSIMQILVVILTLSEMFQQVHNNLLINSPCINTVTISSSLDYLSTVSYCNFPRGPLSDLFKPHGTKSKSRWDGLYRQKSQDYIHFVCALNRDALHSLLEQNRSKLVSSTSFL